MNRRIDIGKVMMTLCDEWSPNRNYENLSVVSHDGNGYVSRVDNIAVEPGTDGAVWMLFAEKGKTPTLWLDEDGRMYADDRLISEDIMMVRQIMQAVSASESLRVAAEQARAEAESLRVAAERRRKDAVLRNTTEHWNSSVGFVPFDGQIIVYSDYRTVDGKDVPGIKIGSGNGYVQDLAFLGEDDTRTLLEHINNETIHITADERFRWGRKLNVDDDDEVIGESLIFNRY